MPTELPIEEVVDVVIAISDLPVSTRDFGTPVFVTAHNLYTDRARTYTTLEAISDDGFSTSSNVYRMASNAFAGTFKPRSIVIGRRVLTNYQCSFNVQNSTAYTVNVAANDGTTQYRESFTFTSDSDATNVEIAEGLATLIEADTNIGPLVAAAESSGALVVTPAGSGLISVGGVTTNIMTSTSSSESATDAITAIAAAQSNFFFLASDSHDSTDQTNFSAWAESNRRIYVTSSQSSDIWTTGTTDILSTLGGLTRHGTLLVAIETADREFPEASVIGQWSSLAPGGSVLTDAQLPGVTPTSLSTTQIGIIEDKNGNYYARRGGTGRMRLGVMVTGRYADIQRGQLWLEARLEENVYAEIVGARDRGQKIAYTDAGVQIISGVVRRVLDEAVQVGLLTSYTVRPPLVENITSVDKADRILRDLPFDGILAGAINTVRINGYLAV